MTAVEAHPQSGSGRTSTSDAAFGKNPAFASLGNNKTRNPLILILAVLLIVGSAAGFGALYLSAGQRTEVLVAAQNIPAGKQITKADLTTAQVSSDDLATVPLSSANEVIGIYTTTAIGKGSALNPAHLAKTLDLETGNVAIAFPINGSVHPSMLEPGRLVNLYSSSGEGGSTELARNVRVLSSTGGDGNVTVTVQVPRSSASAVAAATNNIIVSVLPLGAK